MVVDRKSHLQRCFAPKDIIFIRLKAQTFFQQLSENILSQFTTNYKYFALMNCRDVNSSLSPGGGGGRCQVYGEDYQVGKNIQQEKWGIEREGRGYGCNAPYSPHFNIKLRKSGKGNWDKKELYRGKWGTLYTPGLPGK